MTEDPQKKSIGDELAAKNSGQNTANVLEFDPESGELVVRARSAQPHPDATAVDQIATDGFASTEGPMPRTRHMRFRRQR